MSLHQDKDELDLAAPIVSVSLGLPAIFLFGGLKRSDKPNRYRLEHGDVVVWGGPSRLFFHGVAPLADGEHAVLGRQRINLTFRKSAVISASSHRHSGAMRSSEPGMWRFSGAQLRTHSLDAAHRPGMTWSNYGFAG